MIPVVPPSLVIQLPLGSAFSCSAVHVGASGISAAFSIAFVAPASVGPAPSSGSGVPVPCRARARRCRCRPCPCPCRCRVSACARAGAGPLAGCRYRDGPGRRLVDRHLYFFKAAVSQAFFFLPLSFLQAFSALASFSPRVSFFFL